MALNLNRSSGSLFHRCVSYQSPQLPAASARNVIVYRGGKAAHGIIVVFSIHIWSTMPNFKAVMLLKERLRILKDRHQSSRFILSVFCILTQYNLRRFVCLMLSYLTIGRACSHFLMEWFCEVFCLFYTATFSSLEVFCNSSNVFFRTGISWKIT